MLHRIGGQIGDVALIGKPRGSNESVRRRGTARPAPTIIQRNQQQQHPHGGGHPPILAE